MDITAKARHSALRALIPEYCLDQFKVGFLPVRQVAERDATLLDFDALPEVRIINRAIREDYVRPKLFAEDLDSSVVLMDKPNAHSLHSMMATQSGRTPRKSFLDLTPYERRTFFKMGAAFFRYWNGSETFLPRFSYNHDPHTVDRPGLQSIERFHAHLCLFELDALEKCEAIPLRQIVNSLHYKDYFDPTALLFEKALLASPLPNLKELEVVRLPPERKFSLGYGLGLHLLYRGDPEYFATDTFIAYVSQMHRHLESLFQLEPPDGLLKTVSEKTYSYLKRKPYLAKTVLAYRQLCYSFSIEYCFERRAYLISFFPRLFGELGGAGAFSYKSVHCMVVKRNCKPLFNPLEIESRRDFQFSLMKACEQ